jgi:hypothetical protein
MQRTLIRQAHARYHPRSVYTLWRAASAEDASEKLSREIGERWNTAAESLLGVVRGLEPTRTHAPAMDQTDGARGPMRPADAAAGEALEAAAVRAAPGDELAPSPHFDQLFLRQESADSSNRGQPRQPVSRIGAIAVAHRSRHRREPIETLPRSLPSQEVLDRDRAPPHRRPEEGPAIDPRQPLPAVQQGPVGAAPRRISQRAPDASADGSRASVAGDGAMEPRKDVVRLRDGGGPVPPGSRVVTSPDDGARSLEAGRRAHAFDDADGSAPARPSREAPSVDEAAEEASRDSFRRTSPPMGDPQALPAARPPGITSAHDGMLGISPRMDHGGEPGFPVFHDAASASRTLGDELRAQRRRRKALREWRRTDF